MTDRRGRKPDENGQIWLEPGQKDLRGAYSDEKLESAMKICKCPDGHGGQTSVARPTCPVCGKLMERADR